MDATPNVSGAISSPGVDRFFYLAEIFACVASDYGAECVTLGFCLGWWRCRILLAGTATPIPTPLLKVYGHEWMATER